MSRFPTYVIKLRTNPSNHHFSLSLKNHEYYSKYLLENFVEDRKFYRQFIQYIAHLNLFLEKLSQIIDENKRKYTYVIKKFKVLKYPNIKIFNIF